MGVQDYISEAEALSITGISAKTLARFVEAGYLQKEEDSDGILLFSKKEINDLFMAERATIEASGQSAESQGYNPWRSQQTDQVISACSFTIERTATFTEDKEAQGSEEQIFAHQDIAQNSAAIQSPSTSIPQPEAAATSPASTGEAATTQSVTDTYALFGQNPEEQLNKLHRIITLQEKLLDAREDEIKDLKEQRSWLRTRIEKLEEKSDKEQLILLSETQVIRKLVSAQQQKRSPLRAALEWLGIVEEKNTLLHPTMIDMGKSRSEHTH